MIRRSNFMRSKFTFSWGQNYFCSWDRICSIIFDRFDQEVNTLIMRSKFQKALLGVSISWSFLWLTNWSWDRNSLIMLLFSFDLMIDLLATRTIMRSKLEIMLVWVSISWSKCRPPDQYYWTNSISWTNWILISWNSTS